METSPITPRYVCIKPIFVVLQFFRIQLTLGARYPLLYKASRMPGVWIPNIKLDPIALFNARDMGYLGEIAQLGVKMYGKAQQYSRYNILVGRNTQEAMVVCKATDELKLEKICQILAKYNVDYSVVVLKP